MIPPANENFEDGDGMCSNMYMRATSHPTPCVHCRLPKLHGDFEDNEAPTTIDLIRSFDLEPETYTPGVRVARVDVSGSDVSGSNISDSDADLAIPLEPVPPPRLPRPLQVLSPGTVVGKNYKIDRRIEGGTMGEVYAAQHMGLGKRVALKVIGSSISESDIAIRRFTMEAQALARIQHPSIVAVEHIDELPDGRPYFVMEYLQGESLHARLLRGNIPLPQALDILDQMAQALEVAHEKGVIHRDLKPANTFLVTGKELTVKLIDFGLAKLLSDKAGDSDIDQSAERSESGVAVGTPLYMSPEQARGPHVDHRTDIYALGCIAYELVLGVRPLPHAQTTLALYTAHLHGTPLQPRSIWPKIPPALDRILFAMLAKDPDHRPTLTEIRSVLAGLHISTAPRHGTTLRVRTPKRTLRGVMIAATAIGALATGAALGFIIASKPQRASATTRELKRNNMSPAPLETHGRPITEERSWSHGH